MNRSELAAMALRDAGAVVGMFLRGEIPSRHVWTAVRGGEKYVRAVASGDIASDLEQERRMTTCRACPISVVEVRKHGVRVNWCGQPITGWVDGDARGGCGCLLEGKTAVASEECPRGLWGSSPRSQGDE